MPGGGDERTTGIAPTRAPPKVAKTPRSSFEPLGPTSVAERAFRDRSTSLADRSTLRTRPRRRRSIDIPASSNDRGVPEPSAIQWAVGAVLGDRALRRPPPRFQV